MENEEEVLVLARSHDKKLNKFMRFGNKRIYKKFIAELIRSYKKTTYNVCTYTIHGLIRVIVTDKNSKIVERYTEL